MLVDVYLESVQAVPVAVVASTVGRSVNGVSTGNTCGLDGQHDQLK